VFLWSLVQVDVPAGYLHVPVGRRDVDMSRAYRLSVVPMDRRQASPSAEKDGQLAGRGGSNVNDNQDRGRQVVRQIGDDLAQCSNTAAGCAEDDDVLQRAGKGIRECVHL